MGTAISAAVLAEMFGMFDPKIGRRLLDEFQWANMNNMNKDKQLNKDKLR